MRMGEIEIYDYARQLLEGHGDVAVVEAARKAHHDDDAQYLFCSTGNSSA